MKVTREIESIKAVLFDFDGVVADSMHVHADSWRKVFKDMLDIDISREDIFLREGMSGIASIVDIIRSKGLEPPDEDAMNELRDAKLRNFEQYSICVYKEIPAIFEFLALRGVRMGLVTGSMFRSVRHVLDDHLLGFFKAMITVDMLVKGKPDPEPYIMGIQALELPPDQIIAIENAPLGIRSAVNAGLVCAAIETSLPMKYLYEADLQFRNHADLFTFFRNRIK